MALALNWFPLDVQPFLLRLPSMLFDTWEASTTALRTSLRPFKVSRYRVEESNRIRVTLYDNGRPRSTVPAGATTETFDLRTNPHLARRIVEHSFAEHFRSQDYTVRHTKFDLLVTQPSESSNLVSLESGIALRSLQPVPGDPIGLVVTWHVSAEFRSSLADESLRKIASGFPVVIRREPGDDWQVPIPLRQFKGDYIGIFSGERRGRQLRVFGRDGDVHFLPADRLYIEASPKCIRACERLLGIRDVHSETRRIQQLSLALTPTGRRNGNVLRDRMTAIADLLGHGRARHLEIPMRCYGGHRISLFVSPYALGEKGS